MSLKGFPPPHPIQFFELQYHLRGKYCEVCQKASEENEYIAERLRRDGDPKVTGLMFRMSLAQTYVLSAKDAELKCVSLLFLLADIIKLYIVIYFIYYVLFWLISKLASGVPQHCRK